MNYLSIEAHEKYIKDLIKKHSGMPINLTHLLDYEFWKVMMQTSGVSEKILGPSSSIEECDGEGVKKEYNLSKKLKKFEWLHQNRCKHVSYHFVNLIFPFDKKSKESSKVQYLPYSLLDENRKKKIDEMEDDGLYAPCNH